MKRLLALAALGSTAVVVAACGSTLDTSAPSTVTFGPESLLVYVVSPDTVLAGTTFRATAVAHNETLKPILSTLQCPTVGLTVRVVNAADQVLVSSSGGCTPGEPSRLTTIQPDDSVITTITGSTQTTGALRVQAAYEAVNGRSAIAQKGMFVKGP